MRHVATAAENPEIDLLTQMSLVWQNDQTSKLGERTGGHIVFDQTSVLSVQSCKY